MRALVLADVHSNLEVLEAVLQEANELGFDQIWCLGDVVGYGPDPGLCIDALRRHDVLSVAGNHDRAAAGKLEPTGFNEHALAAIRWTTLQLTFEHYEYLIDMPVRHQVEGFTFVHGSPRSPLMEYLVTPESAVANFPLIETPYCLVGHSHLSFICKPDAESAVFSEFAEGVPFQLSNDKVIFNPGSVGQPRDRDPRASYLIVDTGFGTVEQHRASYDFSTTQEKMKERGLNRYLWERIAYGL